jgi:hypothetical protein
MKKVKLLGFTVLALLAFGAFAAQSALAVEDGKPQILCLVAGCSTLEGTLKSKEGVTSRLEDLNGLTITGTSAEAKLKGCKNDEAGENDINLCIDVPLTFLGTKKGKVACRSENSKGEKSKNPEEIVTLLDLHVGAETHLNAAKVTVLLPVLQELVLGSLLESELLLNCGGVKFGIKGTMVCLLEPGLVNVPITTEVTIVCTVKKETHDPETGSCAVLCEDLGAIGLISTLDGTNKVDSWEEIELKGKLSKDIFIDD